MRREDIADGGHHLFTRLGEQHASYSSSRDSATFSAEADVLAYMGFPTPHRAKLHSTNPLERLNGEIKGRSEVVDIFPNEAAVQRARYMSLETIAPLSDDLIASLPDVAV